MSTRFKIVPDQNGDGRPDRVVSNRQSYITYHNPDGSYTKEDPLIHGKIVVYAGKEYKAFQLTSDRYVGGKNQKDSKVCLVGVKQGQKSCSKKRALKVKRSEVRPARPSLFVYSAESCIACKEIVSLFQEWILKGYCKIELEKVDFEKVDMSKVPGLPDQERLPIVTFRHADGIWQEIRQQGRKHPTDYALDLFQQIDACNMDNAD